MTQKISFFPQAAVLHQCAIKPPVDIKKSTTKNDLIKSQLGSQKKALVSKLKGEYQPETIVTKLSAPAKPAQTVSVDRDFLHLENYKISSLVPEIRIYRREKSGTVTPFYFPISSDYDTEGNAGIIDYKNKSFSSNASAIESFSVTYTGKNPYQASKKFLEAQLSIKVDNISILFDEKPNGQSNYAPLSDLFTIRTVGKKTRPQTVLGLKKKQPQSALESGESCNIIVSLGYSNHMTDFITPSEMKTIQDNRMLINLYYRSHDLNLNNDGSATVNITYQGYLEAKSGNPLYDLVMPTASKTKFTNDKSKIDKGKGKKDIKEHSTGRKLSEDEKKAKAVKEEQLKKIKQNQIIVGFLSIFSKLFASDKIYTISSSQSLIERKILEPKTAKASPTPKTSSSDPGKPDFTGAGFFKMETDGSRFDAYDALDANLVHYFTFGDFLEAYIGVLVNDLETTAESLRDEDLKKAFSDEEIKEQTKYVKEHTDELKKLHILFADVKYSVKLENTSTQKDKVINIADIPISVDMLSDMMYKDIISTRKGFLDIDEMLDSFAPKLLNRAFGELPGADIIRDIVFLTTSFSAPPIDKKKVKKGVVMTKDVPRPTGKSTTKDIKNLSEYIVFHQKPANYNRPPGSGNKKKDLGKGIFHLRANQDRGLVKNISFSKISQPARETYMIFRNGQMYDELRYPHNAVVEMYGNNIFLPAMQVYINPDTLGFGDPRGLDSAARRLGFGGYYTSESVTTTYSAGSLTTTLQLFFNSFPDSTDDPTLPGSITRAIKEL